MATLFGAESQMGSTVTETIQDAFARLIRNTACITDFGGDPAGSKIAGDGAAIGFTTTATSTTIVLSLPAGGRFFQPGDKIQATGAGPLNPITGIPTRLYTSIVSVSTPVSGVQSAVMAVAASTAINFGTIKYGPVSTDSLQNLVRARKLARLDNPFSRTTSSMDPLRRAVYFIDDTIWLQRGQHLFGDGMDSVEICMLDDSKPAIKWIGTNDTSESIDLRGFMVDAKYGIQINDLSWTLTAPPPYAWNINVDVAFNSDIFFSFYSPEGIPGLNPATVSAPHRLTLSGNVHVDPDWLTDSVPTTDAAYINAHSTLGTPVAAPGLGNFDLAYVQQLYNLGCNIYCNRGYNVNISQRDVCAIFAAGVHVLGDGMTNGRIGGNQRYGGVCVHVTGQYGDGDYVFVNAPEIKQFYRQNYITYRYTSGEIKSSFENGLSGNRADGTLYPGRNGTYVRIGQSFGVTLHKSVMLDTYAEVPGVYIEASNFGLHATDNAVSCDVYVEPQTSPSPLGPVLTVSGNTYQLTRHSYRSFLDFPGVAGSEPDPYCFSKNNPGGYFQELYVGGANQWTNTGCAKPDWSLNGAVEPVGKLRTKLKSTSHKAFLVRIRAGRAGGAGAARGLWSAVWSTWANQTDVFSPASGTHTLAINALLFDHIISVFATGTQTGFTQVPSSPGPGQYSVSGTVLTFNSVNFGTSISCLYSVYTTLTTWSEIATGTTITTNFGGVGIISDLGAQLADGTALTLTTGAPAVGQYAVSSSAVSGRTFLTYTFNPADVASRPTIKYRFLDKLFQPVAGDLNLTTGGIEERTVKIPLYMFDTADTSGLLTIYIRQQNPSTSAAEVETQSIQILPDIGSSPLFEDPGNNFRYVGNGELAVRKITSDTGYIDVGISDVRGTSMDGFETVGFGTDQVHNGSFNFWRKSNGDGSFTRFYLQFIDDLGLGVPRRMSFRTQQISASEVVSGDVEIVAFRQDQSIYAPVPATYVDPSSGLTLPVDNSGVINSVLINGDSVKLSGDIVLDPGSNITMSRTGQTITINSSASGSSSSTASVTDPAYSYAVSSIDYNSSDPVLTLARAAGIIGSTAVHSLALRVNPDTSISFLQDGTVFARVLSGVWKFYNDPQLPTANSYYKTDGGGTFSPVSIATMKTDLGLSFPVPIAQGGTGAITAAAARANLAAVLKQSLTGYSGGAAGGAGPTAAQFNNLANVVASLVSAVAT